ncbi:MAG: hypothetical protein HY774_09075 [Acidobacteria bacterium]|nr:hypothetical protein [Acidobacteriota bacterium]
METNDNTLVKVKIEILLSKDSPFIAIEPHPTEQSEIPNGVHLKLSKAYENRETFSCKGINEKFGEFSIQRATSLEWWFQFRGYIFQELEFDMAKALLDSLIRAARNADFHSGEDHSQQIAKLERELAKRKKSRHKADITRKPGPHIHTKPFSRRLIDAIQEIAKETKLRPTQEAVAKKMGYASAVVLRQMIQRSEPPSFPGSKEQKLTWASALKSAGAAKLSLRNPKKTKTRKKKVTKLTSSQ